LRHLKSSSVLQVVCDARLPDFVEPMQAQLVDAMRRQWNASPIAEQKQNHLKHLGKNSRK
jgi:hypothetical protein